MYRLHHLHIRSEDPRATARWYEAAFNFKITSENTRPGGDILIRCQMEDGTPINISGPKTDEQLHPGLTETYIGLEHFAIACDDLEGSLAKLTAMGAEIVDRPEATRPGLKIAFILAPGKVRIELLQQT